MCFQCRVASFHAQYSWIRGALSFRFHTFVRLPPHCCSLKDRQPTSSTRRHRSSTSGRWTGSMRVRHGRRCCATASSWIWPVTTRGSARRRPLTREGVALNAALAALDRVAARTPRGRRTMDLANRVHDVRDRRSADGCTGTRRGRCGWRPGCLRAGWYQKDGLAAIVGYLHSCLHVWRRTAPRRQCAEAIRRTDLRVMHTQQ